MPINRDALLARPFPDVRQTYTTRDTILYALGLGLGQDPMDPDQLRYTYEGAQGSDKGGGLQTLPTMGVVLGFPGFWLSDPTIGADWKRLLHGEQSIEILRPIPPAGTVIGRTRVTDVIDKGPGKGALVFSTRDITDADTGDLLARTTITTFLRGDGGFGGPNHPAPAPHPIPDRTPDQTVTWPTLPQAALIYRLSGDPNPLHADPEIARAAGFDRPVLHGLATFGIAGYALTRAAGAPERIASIQARFTAPVFPGETIETDLWHDGTTISFRARIPARGVTALNNGRATLRP